MLIQQKQYAFAFVLCSLFAVCGVLAPAAEAQTDPQKITATTVADFDTFLDAHPSIEQDLKKNPSLLKDSNYLNSHIELKTFLTSHATVNTAADQNPQRLMNRLAEFEKSGKDIPKADLAAFDDFLDQHAALEKELRKNPSLLTNADYLANHQELKTFLAAHPALQQEISEHPRVVMKAERRFDRREVKLERKEAKLERKESQIEKQEANIERQEGNIERPQVKVENKIVRPPTAPPHGVGRK